MKNEIFWLTLTILRTSLFWLPYILNRISEHQLIPALRNPNRDKRPSAAWANRMMYAHENATENLVLFAPLVMIIQLLQLNNDMTLIASAVYFFSRLAHYLIYTFGIPYLRTLAFFISFLANITLVTVILKSL